MKRTARVETAARVEQRRLLVCSAAALLAGLVYLNALKNPFVYDDYHMIVENPSIHTLASLPTIVLQNVTRPIINISYAADRALWGPEPFGFHVTNVLLHVLNVVLLFQFAWQLAEDRRRRRDGPKPASPVSTPLVAFATAVLLAAHPMMTEAVGYISGRSEVLCATFFLPALMCGRKWIRGDGSKWAVLSIGFWLAALATKEIAAMFPFVLFCYDWLVVRGSRDEKRRRFLRLHAPLMAAAVLAGGLRLALFALVEHPGEAVVRWPYVLLELDVIRRYFTMMFVPAGQSLFHDVPVPSGVFHPRVLIAIGTIGLVVVSAWRARIRANGVASFGIFWFFLLLVPSSALVVLGQGEPMTEHRVYLAGCGLFLAAGPAVGRLMALLASATRHARSLARATLAMGLLLLCAQTVQRNRIWGSPVTLWREAVDQAPGHSRPRLLLGEALQDVGRREEAVEQYRMALRLRPNEEFGYMKLGLCLAELGRLNEATVAFERLRKLDPRSAVASNGLGAVAMLAGQRARARQYFLETIAMDSRNVSARQSLAILDEMEPANPAEALRMCEEIQQIAPGTPGNDECIRRNRSRLGGGSSRR